MILHELIVDSWCVIDMFKGFERFLKDTAERNYSRSEKKRQKTKKEFKPSFSHGVRKKEKKVEV